jgi:hypothetical protein
MRIVNLAVLSLLAVAACQSRPDADESGRATDAADTVVTSNETRDTTIVSSDTSVDVDTTKKEGDKTVDQDTLQK